MTTPNTLHIADAHLLRQAEAVKARRLLEAGFEGEPLEEVVRVADFLASQVPSMDPKSVSYGAYAVTGFTGDTERWVAKLRKALYGQYRKNLIEWMKYALVKRANLGGGGTGIKKVEEGLANFVEAIPSILLGASAKKLSDYLPDTEYFIADRLDPIGYKVLGVVEKDASKAGVFPVPGRTAAARRRFTIKWDDSKRQWYIPFDRDTYNFYDQLVMDGFIASRPRKRWEYPRKKLSPEILRVYDVEGPPQGTSRPAPAPREPARDLATAPSDAPTTPLDEWFFGTWLPANIARFTKVFTDYASSQQSSYTILFTVSGKKVAVKFKRSINTAAEAVEELRYRYTNRRGREAWLEVMDRFIELVGHKSSDSKLMLIIDRMNNLQHSNGLFMEHFPKDVQSWYLPFLNGKYNAPTIGQLAKFIPDKDLKNVLLELSHYLNEKEFRGPGYQDAPARSEYETTGKDLPPPEVNWRERGYPRAPGTKQVDRMDPRVQQGLETLKTYDVNQRTRDQIAPAFVEEAVHFKTRAETARNRLKRLPGVLQDQQRQLERRSDFTPADVQQAMAPWEAWVRDFKALINQEPTLPTDRNNEGKYKAWLEAVERKQAEQTQLEKATQALVSKKRDEALAAWKEQQKKNPLHQDTYGEDYFRDTRLAALRRLTTRVASRFLTSRAGAAAAARPGGPSTSD